MILRIVVPQIMYTMLWTFIQKFIDMVTCAMHSSTLDDLNRSTEQLMRRFEDLSMMVDGFCFLPSM